MGKDPNTVKSNVVKRFMDISAQDSAVDFQPSDFQDELDSTILVRERAKGPKIEPTFAKKPGKIINETNHTVSILHGSTQLVKTFLKRDIASTSSTQKEKIKKTARRKRTILSESTSNSESDEPKKKRMPKKKGEKKRLIWKPSQAPQL